MAHFDAERRELTASLAVYGAPRTGKSTVLRCIYDRVTPERLAGPSRPWGWNPGRRRCSTGSRSELGTISNWKTRVHLYAVPAQRHADNTRRLVLSDADGILFVADSQAERLAENVATLHTLQEHLQERSDDRRDPPLVFLYTKRDLPTEMLLDVAALNNGLNVQGAPAFACDALRGVHQVFSRGAALGGDADDAAARAGARRGSMRVAC